MSTFQIIIDTKEKKPWNLDSSVISGIEYFKLKTGDYTIKGMENKLCIERKASVAEIAQNVHEKRFPKFLDRMSKFPFKYMLCEFSLQQLRDFPVGADLPPKVLEKIRVNGEYLLKCLTRMSVKYGINIIYCENIPNAQRVAIHIMKEVMELGKK